MMRTRSRLTARLLAVSFCFSFTACSSQPAKPMPVAVRGSVTLDDMPIAEATIAFQGADGTTPRQFPVKNGTFEGQVPPGSYKVAVKAYRLMKNPPKLEGDIPGGAPDPNEQYLPEKYNANTELKAEIPAEGAADLKFALKSK